MNRQQQCWH